MEDNNSRGYFRRGDDDPLCNCCLVAWWFCRAREARWAGTVGSWDAKSPGCDFLSWDERKFQALDIVLGEKGVSTPRGDAGLKGERRKEKSKEKKLCERGIRHESRLLVNTYVLFFIVLLRTEPRQKSMACLSPGSLLSKIYFRYVRT